MNPPTIKNILNLLTWCQKYTISVPKISVLTLALFFVTLLLFSTVHIRICKFEGL